MSEKERFDVFDEQMNRIGTASRRRVHDEGLWHRTFQCWIYNVEDGIPRLIFQKRHDSKDTYPGLLDISCAGHLLAGEQVEDGVRELQEELGLAVPFERLIPCGVYAQQKYIANGLIDREYCHVFLYQCDQPLADYRMQPEEVTGLFRLRLDDVKRTIAGDVHGSKANGDGGGIETNRDAAGIKACGVVRQPDGQVHSVSITVQKHDLVPHDDDYFDMLFLELEKRLPQ